MKRILVAAFLLLFSPPAFAACMTVDTARVTAERVGGTFHVLTGATLKRASDFFNATPPETDIAITEAALADMPDGSGYFLIGETGNLCHAAYIEPNHYRALRKLILGVDA